MPSISIATLDKRNETYRSVQRMLKADTLKADLPIFNEKVAFFKILEVLKCRTGYNYLNPLSAYKQYHRHKTKYFP